MTLYWLKTYSVAHVVMSAIWGPCEEYIDHCTHEERSGCILSSLRKGRILSVAVLLEHIGCAAAVRLVHKTSPTTIQKCAYFSLPSNSTINQNVVDKYGIDIDGKSIKISLFLQIIHGMCRDLLVLFVYLMLQIKISVGDSCTQIIKEV